MKRVVITGTSRGLGKDLSAFLVKEGFFVYGTSRNKVKIEEIDHFESIYLDLRDHQSIDLFVDTLTQSKLSIDALIHNAGVAYLDPADVLAEEEIHHTFDVNFFGPLYLTKKLLPLLKKSGNAKLIFISSIVSIDNWPYLGVYAASKTALEAVAFEWAVLLKKWNITVSVIQPNPLPTNMEILRSKNAPHSPYPELGERSLQWEKVSDVCEIVLEILTHPLPQFQYQTGSHSKKTARTFLKEDAVQKSLEKYQKEFSQSLKSSDES